MLDSQKNSNRYDKYKDSGIEWIGEIPDSWNNVRLRFLCNIQTGNKDTVDKNEYGEYPFYVRSPIIERIDTYSFDGEAILTAGDGVGAGKVFHYVNGKFDYHQRVYNLHNFNKICAKFLFYYLKENFYKEIEQSNAKSTVDSIRLPMLLDFPIVFAKDLKEQEAIAGYLDRKCGAIDETIEKQKSVIEKLKEYKQSIITQAVTKGLDKSAPMKDSGIEWIGQIPQHWDSIKLKFCSYIRARLGWKGLKAEEYVEEGYPLLSAFNIVNSKLIFENLNFINQFRYDESPEIKLQTNDILLVKDGAGIGKCAIVENMPIPSTANGSLAVISTNYRLVAKFLYYYFISTIFQAYIDRLKDGMGVPHLFQADLKEIQIVIPKEQEQKNIVDFLDKKCSEIDKTIEDKEKLIETLVEYKKSLIYECVTGKRKVVA